MIPLTITSWLGICLAAAQGQAPASTPGTGPENGGLAAFQVPSPPEDIVHDTDEPRVLGWTFTGPGGNETYRHVYGLQGNRSGVQGLWASPGSLVVRTDAEGRANYQFGGAAVSGHAVRNEAGSVTVTDAQGREVLVLEKTADGRLVVPPDATLTVPLRAPRRPALGVRVDALPPALVKQLDLSQERGVLVTELVEGGAAAGAGLEAYDVLLEVDGRAVTASSLSAVVSSLTIGERIEVSVLRGGRERTLELEVGEAPRQDVRFFDWGSTPSWIDPVTGTFGALPSFQGTYGLQWGDAGFTTDFTAPFVDGEGNVFFGDLSTGSEDPPAQEGEAPPAVGEDLDAELERLRATLEALEAALSRLETGPAGGR